jgi:hypothetical protein
MDVARNPLAPPSKRNNRNPSTVAKRKPNAIEAPPAKKAAAAPAPAPVVAVPAPPAVPVQSLPVQAEHLEAPKA